MSLPFMKSSTLVSHVLLRIIENIRIESFQTKKKRTMNESDPELVTSREKALPTGYFDNSSGHNSLKHCLDN